MKYYEIISWSRYEYKPQCNHNIKKTYAYLYKDATLNGFSKSS